MEEPRGEGESEGMHAGSFKHVQSSLALSSRAEGQQMPSNLWG